MDTSLHDLAREKIDSGELPSSPSAVCWAGPGGGEVCTLCGETVTGGEIAFELQSGDGAATLHAVCHSAWLAAAGH